MVSRLKEWLFPGAEGNVEAELPVIGFPLRDHIDATGAAKAAAEKGSEPDDLLLEQQDADALDEAVRHVRIKTLLELKKKQMRANSPLYTGRIYRRTFAWSVLAVYLLFVYGVIYYVVYFAAYVPTNIASISSSLTATYFDFADAYYHATNPPMPQEVGELMGELYELHSISLLLQSP